MSKNIGHCERALIYVDSGLSSLGSSTSSSSSASSSPAFNIQKYNGKNFTSGNEFVIKIQIHDQTSKLNTNTKIFNKNENFPLNSKFSTTKYSNGFRFGGSETSEGSDAESDVSSEPNPFSLVSTNEKFSDQNFQFYEKILKIQNKNELHEHAGKDDEIMKFHLNEFEDNLKDENTCIQNQSKILENFVGFRNILKNEFLDEIKSDNGTIRGVKNRVRDGIATFLQSPEKKILKEREEGRVVLYSTSMGVVRETFQKCQKVKQILRNLLIRFDERDCYMNPSFQKEIKERLNINFQDFQNSKSNKKNKFNYPLPQLFIEGQHFGGVEVIEKLNETGELRKLLQRYKSKSVLNTCGNCGGFRMLPCPICNGSKKSIHRNHFTEEFIALKCMSCDISGLVKCHLCNK